MNSETMIHTVKMSAENIPVLTLYESVGSFVVVYVSVLRDSLGIPKMMTKTSTGMRIPTNIIKLGVAVQSLKKHIIRPNIPNTQTAIVPFPTPNTKP
jgi:hypothetical protein